MPLSMTRIFFLPPPSISNRRRVAWASIEFSTSSLTTEAGLSTTSPAAIWLARSSESIRICETGLSDGRDMNIFHIL